MSRTQMIRGLPFPNVPWYYKENIEQTLDYVPRDGDIVLASYPKTGTTWLQYIVLQITSYGEHFPSFNEALYELVPFMEMTGTSPIQDLKGIRFYKHHYPYNMVQKNEKAKYLYIYRNPEDTFISYYHFMQNIREEKIDFEEYFEDFLSGAIEYGSYFKNILSYLSHKDDENVLIISYDKLHVRRKEGILRIAKFLGDEYFQRLSSDESLLDRIVERTSFDYMKANLSYTLRKFESEDTGRTVNFFRKGVIGDGKISLSPDHLERLRNRAKEIMEGTEILKEWSKE